VQWFIVEETQWFNFIPIGILYKHKGIVKEGRINELILNIRNKSKVQGKTINIHMK
jgi:hypothetical protein